ncbi:MAG: hypothetical protein IJU65_06265 [Desulfovibrio sp.]|nr:hypothetical protein [Desulfovibrio sp.]
MNDMDLLGSSPLFDAGYYLENNQDVLRAQVDPAKHFLEFGAKEGRNPSKKFSIANYKKFLKGRNIQLYEENPLLHFIRNQEKLYASSPFFLTEDGLFLEMELSEGSLARERLNIYVAFNTSTKHIQLSELTTAHYNRLSIHHHSFTYECCLLPSTKKRLYVFLSAYAIHRAYPSFMRKTYSSVFDGYCLYIDDPSRQINFAQKAICFYYGTRDDSVVNGLFDIIKKICDIHNIEYNNITFISSSNGAFASIYISYLLKYSKCIALCPQISIFQYYKFENKLDYFNKIFNKVSITSQYDDINSKRDTFQFNLLPMLQENVLQSKIFIFSNVYSPSDCIQMRYLQKNMGLKLTLGFNAITNNLFIYLAAIDSTNPHLAQPMESFCKVADMFLDGRIDNSDATLLFNSYLTELSRYYSK